MSIKKKNEKIEDRVYALHSQTKLGHHMYCIVVLPKNTDMNNVRASWSYCVRWTAQGLDIPDYPAALAMMRERYPSWQFIETTNNVFPISYNGGFSDADVIPPEANT